ncbi:MAG: hypothetical protein H6605_02685 [Flavobacteriales bacterium]|nr:hypothetical protein [Flavobacteriales bacterium]
MIILESTVFTVIVDILKFIIPSIIVFSATYIMMRQFLEEDYKKKLLEIKEKNTGVITPLKLQAYERFTILLERIAPENMVVRLSQPRQTAAELRQLIIRNVAEEFNHNISQQIYISTQGWELINLIKEQILNIVDISYKKLDENAKGADLGKAIINELMSNEIHPTRSGIEFLKKEIALVM